ncbi:hypothetical protein PG996_005509 [Apiospora saccharicola]|uniref:Uncharacterized protein n=1 Tax=Apiospora saccharicola TaxID=335842 RepID=A0ABR1VLN3_9PEZI
MYLAIGGVEDFSSKLQRRNQDHNHLKSMDAIQLSLILTAFANAETAGINEGGQAAFLEANLGVPEGGRMPQPHIAPLTLQPSPMDGRDIELATSLFELCLKGLGWIFAIIEAIGDGIMSVRHIFASPRPATHAADQQQAHGACHNGTGTHQSSDKITGGFGQTHVSHSERLAASKG